MRLSSFGNERQQSGGRRRSHRWTPTSYRSGSVRCVLGPHLRGVITTLDAESHAVQIWVCSVKATAAGLHTRSGELANIWSDCRLAGQWHCRMRCCVSWALCCGQ